MVSTDGGKSGLPSLSSKHFWSWRITTRWRWPQTISVSSWWKHSYPRKSICVNGKHARAAFFKWYVMSASAFPEPIAESMQHNHLCVPKPSFTTMVCLVNMSVCEAFIFKPALSNVVIKTSSNDAIPSALSLKIKMSSAKRRSSKGGYPSWKSIPHPFTSAHARQSCIAHCNTEQNRRGLSTHPCRTPAFIGKIVLLPQVPFTSPVCSQYSTCKIQTKCAETPCSNNDCQSASQSILSKIFDRSKLTIHNGMFAAKNLSLIKFAVTKCSSSRLPLRNPCCSSGWLSSKHCSMCPRIIYANVL